MRINSLRNSEYCYPVRSFRLSQYLLSKRMVDANSKSLSLLKLYRLGNMFANSSKSSVPRQKFLIDCCVAYDRQIAWPSYGFLFRKYQRMLIYSLISPLRTSLMVRHISPGWMWGPRFSQRRDLCHSVMPRGNDVLHNQRVTGRGLLNAVRSNCSSRRRLIMREKVEMLLGI